MSINDYGCKSTALLMKAVYKKNPMIYKMLKR